MGRHQCQHFRRRNGPADVYGDTRSWVVWRTTTGGVCQRMMARSQPASTLGSAHGPAFATAPVLGGHGRVGIVARSGSSARVWSVLVNLRVHPLWSSDIPGTAMAAEPALPACGGGGVVPSGLDGASGAARQHQLLRNADAVFGACAPLPPGRVVPGRYGARATGRCQQVSHCVAALRSRRTVRRPKV